MVTWSYVLLAGSVVVAPAPVAAQRAGEVWFEMLVHLEDFERHYLSTYSRLYDFGPYERRSKSWVSRAELEELRASWARERERVAKEIARLEAEPVLKALHNARHRVNKNAFFRDVDKQWVDEHAPFHFVIQRPPKDRPGYYEKLAAEYAPWAKALHEVFLREFAEPLGLSLREDYGVFLVALLGTEGAYDDYAKRNQAFNPAGARAHYDPRLRLSVTYEPWASGSARSDERRHAFMHELVHAFQHAYSVPRESLLPHPWLNEGFAEYLSSGSGPTPASLAQHPLDAGARELVANILKDARAREAYLLPLDELLDANSYRDIVVRIAQRARGSQVRADLALSIFYRQAYLLVYYLERIGGEAVQVAFRRYLKSYFAGRGDRPSFEKAFAGIDLEKLESAWLDWITPENRGWRPARRAPATSDGGAGPETLVYDPERLRPALEVPERALAFALWQVVQGSPETARERLEDCAASLDAGSEWHSRIARELERVNAWIVLRERYIRWLIERQGKLTVEVDVRGKPTRRKLVVTGLEGGRVLFEKNDSRLESLALADLDNPSLIREMSSARDFDCGWERHYLTVLEGRDNWERRIPKDDPAADSLRTDAPSYTALLNEGSLLTRIDALAAAEPPSGQAAAELVLDEIAALVAAGTQSAALKEARPALQALALLCASESARERPLTELLRGQATDLGGGRVRLEYRFSKPEELEDFEPCAWPPMYPQDDSQAGAGSFQIQGGVLVGRGLASMRHLAVFSGAQVVRYSVRWDQWGMPCDFGLLICEEADSGYVGCIDHGSVIVAGGPRGNLQVAQNSAPIQLEKPIQIEIRHDGSNAVQVKTDGQTFGPLNSAKPARGNLVLLVNSVVPITVDNLEIEAQIEPDSLERLRNAWARRRAASILK